MLRTLLEHARLRIGTVIVFDELFNYCGFECHELLALFEAQELLGLGWKWLGVKQKGKMQAALIITAIDPPSSTSSSSAVAARYAYACNRTIVQLRVSSFLRWISIWHGFSSCTYAGSCHTDSALY